MNHLKLWILRLLILGKYDVEDAEYLKSSELIEKFELKEKVDFAGFVSNPFAYFSRASVFVFSSKWEGLPGVLIQALAAVPCRKYKLSKWTRRDIRKWKIWEFS